MGDKFSLGSSNKAQEGGWCLQLNLSFTLKTVLIRMIDKRSYQGSN